MKIKLVTCPGCKKRYIKRDIYGDKLIECKCGTTFWSLAD